MVLKGQSDRRRPFFFFLAVVILITLCVFLPLPTQYSEPRDSILKLTKEHLPDVLRPELSLDSPPAKSKYAFATFLANEDSSDTPMESDEYFIATRILAFQILHAPETRSTKGIPFIVVVNSGVSEAKRDRLRKDGAIVWEPAHIDPKWIVTEVQAWQSVLGKLRLWELTQYELVCFIDADTVLTRPLDGIFDDPAVQAQPAGVSEGQTREDEGSLPDSYVFAGSPEMFQEHGYPPTSAHNDFPNFEYFNAGFFVLQPNLKLLDYYISLTNTPDRFPPQLPEQNLLNYAHRPEGNMPWKHLDTTWNIHYPTVGDVEGGVASIHEKWWSPVSPALSSFLIGWRWRMEGFQEANDAFRTGQ